MVLIFDGEDEWSAEVSEKDLGKESDSSLAGRYADRADQLSLVNAMSLSSDVGKLVEKTSRLETDMEKLEKGVDSVNQRLNSVILHLQSIRWWNRAILGGLTLVATGMGWVIANWAAIADLVATTTHY